MSRFSTYVSGVACALTMLFVGPSQAEAEIRVVRDKNTNEIVSVKGLSDNDGCFDDHGQGLIERARMEKGRLEGFFYRDHKSGSTHVNTSFYHGSESQRSEISAWLQKVIRPSTEVKVGLKVCGAGGRIIELDTIEIVQRASASASNVVSSPAAQSPAGASTDVQWSYGQHPVLGLSAHVTVGSDAFGLACGFGGVDLFRADTVSVRMTPGVAPSATSQYGILMFYDRGGGGGNYPFKAAGPLVQHPQNACGLLTQLQKSSRLLIVEGRQLGLSWVSASEPTVAEIEQRGVKKRIVGEKDFHLLSDFREFPLKGSGSAIRRLINACPAIKADLRNDCGV